MNEVGYKKPPKASQFKPGQSGNPKGRPKKKKMTDEEALKIVNEFVRALKAATEAIDKWVAQLKKMENETHK